MTDAVYRIRGATGEWEVVIGLEVHAQVTSSAKLFSGAATAFGAEPNTQVSLVDAAMPGMLPVPNRECIRQAVRTGMAIDAQINRWSRFDRKNYFYADLPQGYQISQLYHPLVGEGHVDVAPDEKNPDAVKRIGVERIHVEQDAGKLMHDQHPTRSYVDLNRSGVALMEIVSRPDMRSPAEAGAYLTKLRSVLRYVGSCDGNMDQGSMRADVNVSVRKPGGGELGTRTETKNVNSIRFVMQAIEHEAKRQVALLEDGGAVVQETRLFNPDTGTTRSMRSKEDAHDYRYFPDPDLLPLELDETFVDECRASLPELPDAKRRRYEALGVTPYNAGVLTAEVETARWFDALLDAGAPAGQASNWVTGELFAALNRLGKGVEASPVAPAQAAELLQLVADGTLSGSLAKQVFEVMLETGQGAAAIVEERGLKQTSDTGAIEAVIADVLAKNPGQLEQYRGGKVALFGFFVGQTMKAMGGKANPQVVNELLGKALGVMPAASLRIADDELSSSIVRDVEASFAITLPPGPLAGVTTVGQLHDLIVQQARYPGGDGTETSLALDALRRALEPFGAPPDAGPGLLLADLGLPRLRATRRALNEATGLTLPGLSLGWLGYAGVVLATLGPFVTWKLGFGWVGAVNILLGLALVKADPGSWSGEWKTLGGLARATAALNHYVLATRGAQQSPAALWRALTTLLASRASVPAAEIGRDTRLSV